MSRLAFLHQVPLFAETSLDDLIAVDHALGSETYLGGEAIVTEGATGDRLCIVYRGEVSVILVNLGQEPVAVERGDRIAQLLIAPVERAELVESPSLPPTGRGSGGFGHTGRG